MAVMGFKQSSLSRLDIYGSMRADGQSYVNATTNSNNTLIGGLGGTILIFIQEISLFDNSFLSVAGGHRVPVVGGGGGGGRFHFHRSKIGTGDEKLQFTILSAIKCTICTTR